MASPARRNFQFPTEKAKPGRFGGGGGGGVKAHSPLPFPKHKELLGGKSLQFSYSLFPLPTGKSVPPFLLKLRPRVRLEFDGLWWFGESRQLSTMSCCYFFPGWINQKILSLELKNVRNRIVKYPLLNNKMVLLWTSSGFLFFCHFVCFEILKRKPHE